MKLLRTDYNVITHSNGHVIEFEVKYLLRNDIGDNV